MRLRLVFAALAAVSLAGCASVPSGRHVHFWNPATWFSHAPANKADAARAGAARADADAAAQRVQLEHSAHIEFEKARAALSYAPASPNLELGLRFLGNGLNLSNQVDPLLGAEQADLRRIVEQLRSENLQLRAAGEKLQSAAETLLAQESRAAASADARARAAEKAAGQANDQLRKAYDRENAMANTLRNQHFIVWAAGAVILLLFLASLYVKMQLSGVGEAVHALGSALPADAFGKVVSALDGSLSSLGQSIVHKGRTAAAMVEAKLNTAAGLPR